MTILSMLVGTALLLITIVDLVSTTVVVSSNRGPVTGMVARLLWQSFLRVSRRLTSHRLLEVAGPIIVFSIIVTWLLLLITGWSLIFGAAAEPLIEVETGEPVANLGRMYFAASMILGRGSQVSQPVGSGWRLVEQLAGATGVLLVSLSIAYVIPVVASITESRRVAGYISSLGTSHEEIIRRSWAGATFGDLHLHLIALTPLVSSMSQRHLAYPVLHFFHGTDRHTAVAPSVVALDEALTVLELYVREEWRPHPSAMAPLRTAIGEFLLTRRSMGVKADTETMPPFTLVGLREDSIPVVREEEGPGGLSPEELGERRRLLRALLHQDGWDWEDEWEGYASQPSTTKVQTSV